MFFVVPKKKDVRERSEYAKFKAKTFPWQSVNLPFSEFSVWKRSGQIDKYECLVRMLDEQGEPISPIHFLDLAKKIRLYRTLPRRMVDLALERFEGQPWSFSLNLSCEDLLDRS